jgi:proteic killer suppression protein
MMTCVYLRTTHDFQIVNNNLQPKPRPEEAATTMPTLFPREKSILPLTTDNIRFTVYPKVIRSFKHRGLKRLFEHDDRSGIRPDLVNTVQEVLTVLDDAVTVQELNLPGYRLHPLKRDLKGFWFVTVRANWRIIFRFEGTNAFDVELTDYH